MDLIPIFSHMELNDIFTEVSMEEAFWKRNF